MTVRRLDPYTRIVNRHNKPPKPCKPALAFKRLLDQLRERSRHMHYSLRTEQAYVHWVTAFVRWHGLRHPREMGSAAGERYLSHLVSERRRYAGVSGRSGVLRSPSSARMRMSLRRL